MASSSSSAVALASRRSEDLWATALDNLKASDQAFLQISGSNRLEILGEVLRLVKDTEKVCLKKRFKWKNKKGELVILRDVFEKMVVWIEKFKGIGDNIVQYDPGHAALPWAAARLILQAAVNDVQTNGAIVEGLELVFNLIAKMGAVEQLYLQPHLKLQDHLRAALIELYTSVLEYLAEAHRYFNQKTIVRLARSIIQLEEVTTKFITKIKIRSNEVDAHVRLISGDILSHTNSKLGQVDGTLTDLALRIRKLDNIDARSNRVQGLLDEEIRKLGKILMDLDIPIARIATKLSSLNDQLKESERLKIFEWLSMIPYTSHHRSKEKILMPGSGAWLLKKPEFIEWMGSSTSSILWLHGIPGSGKSMLVARVIQYLQSRMPATDGQASLAYFYCARTANEPERSDPVELLNSIVEQLSCCDEESPIRQPVVNSYFERKREARGRKPERLCLEDCVTLILALLDANPATIVIDGLDECDPIRRQDLLDALRKIITESNNVVKVFVSSRDDHDLVHRLSQTPNLYIEAVDNMDDIRNFVTSSVDEAIQKERILCGRVSRELRTAITDKLIEEANGMFRLVSLHIESLCNPHRIKTKANVLDSLAHLPKDLEVSYDTILTQIRQTQDPNPLLAERVLKWLLCAREPLCSKTFLVAVCSDMADQDLLQRSDILSICCNLVVYDGETDRFRLAHLSVREHLEKLDGYSIMKSNAFAAEQCLSWFFTIERCKEDWSRALVYDESFAVDSVPFCKEIRANILCLNDLELFWQHADTNWGDYARLAGCTREHGRLRMLLQEFLLFNMLTPRRPGLEFAAWVRRIQEDYNHPCQDRNNADLAYHNNFFYEQLSADPLFVASTFDLAEIVTVLVNNSFSWSLTCGQAAAVWDAAKTLKVILDSLHQGHSFPPGYLHLLIIEAVSSGSIEALRLILDMAGGDFVRTEDLCRIIKEIDQRGKKLDGTALQLLLQANRGLQVNEGVFEAAFACQTKGLGTLHSLLNTSTGMELTIKLLLTALSNRQFTDQIIGEVLRFHGALYITPKVLSFIANCRRTFWISCIVQRWDRLTSDMEAAFGSKILLRMCTIKEFVQIADEQELPLHPDVWAILMRDIDQPLEISWTDLHMLASMHRASEYLVLLQRMNASITTPALNSLVAFWDANTMRRVLEFQNIEITDSIIRAAAGNIKHGEDIIKVLLEHEAMMDVGE